MGTHQHRLSGEKRAHHITSSAPLLMLTSESLIWTVCEPLERVSPLESNLMLLPFESWMVMLPWSSSRMIERRRPNDDAPDVRGAVAALRHEHFRRAPAGLDELGRVGTLEIENYFRVARSPQLGDRGEVDARPRIHVVLAVRREGDSVIAVGVGERSEPGAVEVDPVVLQEVRILLRVHSARAEHDLLVGLVHALHAAHEPVPLRDLAL